MPASRLKIVEWTNHSAFVRSKLWTNDVVLAILRTELRRDSLSTGRNLQTTTAIRINRWKACRFSYLYTRNSLQDIAFRLVGVSHRECSARESTSSTGTSNPCTRV